MVDNVEKSDKVWDEATQFRNDKYNWKMGTDFKACNEKEFIQSILDWGDSSIEDRIKKSLKNKSYIIDNFSAEKIGRDYLNLLTSL